MTRILNRPLPGRGLLRALGCILVLAGALHALDYDKLKPQGYVSDFANVIDASTRQRIEEYCGRVERATGVQMAIVTLPSLEEEPIEDVANTLYRKWGVGKKGKDEGIMLLLAIKEHKNRIEVGYGLEPILPDGFVGSILREIRPLLREGQYGPAMLAAAEEMGSRIASAKGVKLDFTLGARHRQPVSSQRRTGIPWFALIVGGLVLFWIIGRLGGRGGSGGGGGSFLTGMILGNLLGRGGGAGGWGGGGGFGGFSSGGGGGGGGFGGFGGGDSGGGGASSDW